MSKIGDPKPLFAHLEANAVFALRPAMMKSRSHLWELDDRMRLHDSEFRVLLQEIRSWYSDRIARL